MSHNLTDAARLREAADLIESKGWYTSAKSPESVEGGRCIYLALCDAQFKVGGNTLEAFDSRSRIYRALCDYLGIFQGPLSETRPIIAWNDTVGRTKLEVLDALRGTARVLEAA